MAYKSLAPLSPHGRRNVADQASGRTLPGTPTQLTSADVFLRWRYESMRAVISAASEHAQRQIGTNARTVIVQKVDDDYPEQALVQKLTASDIVLVSMTGSYVCETSVSQRLLAEAERLVRDQLAHREWLATPLDLVSDQAQAQADTKPYLTDAERKRFLDEEVYGRKHLGS